MKHRMGQGVALALMLADLAGIGPIASLSAQPLPFLVPVAPDIEAFYQRHPSIRIWTRDAASLEAARDLAQVLRRAPVDGLANGPDLARDVEAAAARAGVDPTQRSTAEILMSAAWVQYVRAIRADTPGMVYGSKPPTRPSAEDILGAAVRAGGLAQHVRRVSEVNPTYAALREEALRSSRPDPKVLLNMERARAIPGEGRFVLINVTDQRLWMMEDGRPVDSMKVVVGRRDTPTPMISSVIHYVTLNPYWNVPDNLIRKTIAPTAARRGEEYLRPRGYEVLSDWSPSASVVPASSVDWKAVTSGAQTVRIRQLPGPDNSMGRIKISFPNSEDIYLHDTPNRPAFDKASRDLSNGCIRLEDAKRLARWLLGREPVSLSREAEQFVPLPKGVPIVVTYLTLKPEGGALTAERDIYGWDAVAGAGNADAAAGD